MEQGIFPTGRCKKSRPAPKKKQPFIMDFGFKTACVPVVIWATVSKTQNLKCNHHNHHSYFREARTSRHLSSTPAALFPLKNPMFTSSHSSTVFSTGQEQVLNPEIHPEIHGLQFQAVCQLIEAIHGLHASLEKIFSC